MTDEQINIAIEQARGWRNPRPARWECWDEPPAERVVVEDASGAVREVLSYTTDLNAMHSAWESLTVDEQLQFSRNLWTVVAKGYFEPDAKPEIIAICVENASAKMRADAFLQTIQEMRKP